MIKKYVSMILFSLYFCVSIGSKAMAQGPLDDIDAASHAFDDAQFRKDAAAIDMFLADDFKFVRGSGKFTDRNEFIAIFVDPAISFEPFVVENREIIMLGSDVAIVIAEGTLRGMANGESFYEHFRFADTFERRDGRWQVVYVQVTPILP